MSVIMKALSMKGVTISIGAPPAPSGNSLFLWNGSQVSPTSTPTTGIDSSGNNNTLYLNTSSYNSADALGAVSWTPDNYGVVNSSTSLSSITTAMTIATWVKFPSFLSGSNPVVECSFDNAWGFRVDGGGTSLNLVKYNVADQVVAITQLNTSEWYQLTAAVGILNTKYYINGALVGTSNNSSAMNAPVNSELTFAYSPYTGDYSSVTMGMCNIYDYQLSGSQVATLFNNTKTPYGL